MKRISGPLVALAWIAACVLGAVALILLIALLFGKITSSVWISFIALALLIGAALLFLPPLWRSPKSRWLNAFRVALAILFTYLGLFFLPVETHTVKLDMPTLSQH